MSDSVIDVQDLEFRYWNQEVLRGVTFDVPAGSVCGLMGENGAGKTTLIKLLLGRLTPQQGFVRVFGDDPIADPVGVLGRIGYLSEDRDMPNWMTVGEFVPYMRAFFANWDDRFAEELRDMFELSTKSLVSELSRGQRARLGLLVALAHRPPLLLLDEPSSGLDAIVRRDILHAVVRVVSDEGRTVFFSSHLLDDLQRVSDRVVMLKDGKVQLAGDVNEMLQSHVHLTVSMHDRGESFDHVDVVSRERDGNDWKVIIGVNEADQLRKTVGESGGRIVRQSAPTLEELFVAVNGSREDEQQAS